MAFLDNRGVKTLWELISSKFSRKEHIHPYTPEGTVTPPEISINKETTTIKEISSVGTLPEYTAPTYSAAQLTHSYDEDEQIVSLNYIQAAFSSGSFNPGTLPQVSEETVLVSVEASAEAPTFTGISNTTGSENKQ